MLAERGARDSVAETYVYGLGLSSSPQGASSSIFAQDQYGPFGEVIRATGPMAKLNPFRFSTKYQDDETDLVYYGYRYYNPSTGRWNSPDPVAENGWRSNSSYSPLGTPLRTHGRRLSTVSKFTGDGSRRTKQLDPSNDENLLYAFCLNDPLGAIDLLGLNIYLQEGNNTGDPVNDRCHMAVCVDTYNVVPRPGYETPDPIGKICFSFGVKPGLAKFVPVLPGLHWLGFYMPHPGTCTRGGIYQAAWPGGKVIAELDTTPVQDWRWQTWMQCKRVSTEDAYTLTAYNCRLYSILEFLDAPEHL